MINKSKIQNQTKGMDLETHNNLVVMTVGCKTGPLFPGNSLF